MHSLIDLANAVQMCLHDLARTHLSGRDGGSENGCGLPDQVSIDR